MEEEEILQAVAELGFHANMFSNLVPVFGTILVEADSPIVPGARNIRYELVVAQHVSEGCTQDGIDDSFLHVNHNRSGSELLFGILGHAEEVPHGSVARSSIPKLRVLAERQVPEATANLISTLANLHHYGLCHVAGPLTPVLERASLSGEANIGEEHELSICLGARFKPQNVTDAVSSR